MLYNVQSSIFNLRSRSEGIRSFMDKVAIRAKGDMAKRGKVMLPYQSIPSKSIGNCFRMVVTALPKRNDQSMNAVLDEIWEVVQNYQMDIQ